MTTSSRSNDEEKQQRKEEGKAVSYILAVLAKRDRQLYEWLKEFCQVTGLKPMDVIIQALRAFRIDVEAGEILKQINAAEWQKIKMAIMYDLETSLKMAGHLHALASIWVGDIHKALINDLSQEYYLKRTYRERAKAFDAFAKMLQAMAQNMVKMSMYMDVIMQKLNELVEKKAYITQQHGNNDGEEKTQTIQARTREISDTSNQQLYTQGTDIAKTDG